MVLDPGQTNYEDYTYFGFRYAEVRGLRRPSANTENNFPDQEVRSWGQNLFTTSDNAVFLKNWTSQEMSKSWITGCKRPLNWKTSRCPCGWPTGRSMAKRSISSLMIPGKRFRPGLHCRQKAVWRSGILLQGRLNLCLIIPVSNFCLTMERSTGALMLLPPIGVPGPLVPFIRIKIRIRYRKFCSHLFPPLIQQDSELI